MLRALESTAALISLGALGGAVGGALAPVIGYIVISGASVDAELWPVILTNAALFGAMCGVIAAPVLWWTAMGIPRRLRKGALRSALEGAR